MAYGFHFLLQNCVHRDKLTDLPQCFLIPDLSAGCRTVADLASRPIITNAHPRPGYPPIINMKICK